MTMDGSHEQSCGETLLQQNFCIHSVFIIVILSITIRTFLCACVFLLFCLGVSKINTSSDFIKLDYQFITRAITTTKMKEKHWARYVEKGTQLPCFLWGYHSSSHTPTSMYSPTRSSLFRSNL